MAQWRASNVSVALIFWSFLALFTIIYPVGAVDTTRYEYPEELEVCALDTVSSQVCQPSLSLLTLVWDVFRMPRSVLQSLILF